MSGIKKSGKRWPAWQCAGCGNPMLALHEKGMPYLKSYQCEGDVAKRTPVIFDAH